MSPATIGIIGIVVLFLLFFSRMPIGFVMMLVGFLGFSYLVTVDAGISKLGGTVYYGGFSYTLCVIPLFLLMAQFAFYSGVSQDTYYAIYKWVGRLPGGICIATIGGCAAFAAITGSSVATASTMGMVALPEMKRYKYDDKLATASIAAGGTLGILIPPSIAFVIYGVITEQSIGRLFIAGILPGLLLSSLFMLVTYIICRINPKAGPRGPIVNFRDRVTALGGVWGIILLFALVIGGIYAGIFTPTEAAAIGAFGALIIALSKGALTRQNFIASLYNTSRTTGMIFTVIIGAFMFNYFLARSEIPFLLSGFVTGLAVSRYVILGGLLFMYLILGCIMESYSMIVLTVPILMPALEALGFDLVWYGVIMVIAIEMGLITPPVGLNVFVIHGVAKDVPLYSIFKGVWPFVVAMAICIIILTVFPQIALFLPSKMIAR